MTTSSRRFSFSSRILALLLKSVLVSLRLWSEYLNSDDPPRQTVGVAGGAVGVVLHEEALRCPEGRP